MDQCIVCFKFNEDIFLRINVHSNEWNECNIQRIIEKHLWWWYLKKPTTNGSTQWICRQCWQELSSFHNFYKTIVQIHRQYQPMLNSFITSEIYDGNNREIKVKQESGENKNEQKLWQRKSSESNANLQIEELNIVDVKSEFQFERNDNESEANYQCGEMETSTKYEIDSLDIVPKDDLENNINENNYDVTGSDMEDKILMPLMKNTKTKLKQKNKKKALTKTKSVSTARPKKFKTNDKSEKKFNMLVNDDFFTEPQHKLECSICNKPLSNFRNLKEHFRSDHNIRGYAVCCGKKFLKRCLLIDHINVHKNPDYFKCNVCNKLFTLRHCLESHIKTHTERERIFRCEECGKSYFTKKIFDRHKLSHVPEVDRNFQCNQCNKKFASRYLQRQHETTTHNKKYFKICDICGKSYRDNFSFVRHMEEHAGATPSCETCNLCGVKLTNKYALTQHIKMIHNEENLQEQICPYCSRISPNISAHRKHIKYTHTMERKHSCHMCDKSFRRPVELKEHLSSHTGEPLYTCPHCPRTFISNANMYKHRKLAHRLEWEEGRLRKFNEPRRKRVDKNILLDSINTTKSCQDKFMSVPPGLNN